MTDPIRPALTPEDWEEFAKGTLHTYSMFMGPDENSHGVAATLLYGQPFGFTWEDVDRLAQCAGYIDRNYVAEGMYSEPIQSAADRIAALLPPRKTPSE